LTKLCLSKGNTKIGKIPNISFTPIVSCASGIPCANGKCYALQSFIQYPAVRDAWRGNLKYWTDDPKAFIEDLVAGLTKFRALPYFRWFVGGDMPDMFFLAQMCKVAKLFPDTKFLAYTKKYELVNEYFDAQVKPDNLQIVMSAWPNVPFDNRHALPVAYYHSVDNIDTRIDHDLFVCTGKCDKCKHCWDTNDGVIFEEH
jgi:hypothetical protein